MSQQIGIRRLAGMFGAFIALGLCLPASAQTREEMLAINAAAKERFIAAQNVQIRAIALDPCNIKPSLPAMVKQLEVPAREAHWGIQDHVEMFGKMADKGCENVNKQLPELELFFTAVAQQYLDACSYAPGKDFSVELKMARLSYGDPASFSHFMKQILDRPCAGDFIAAKLTGMPLVKTAAEPAATPPASAPAPQQRRRALPTNSDR